jgi:hypothetical protein
MLRTPRMFECTEAEAQLLTRVLAMQQELDALALSAAHGTVLDACEEKVIIQGRELQTDMLEKAVARRVESAEKKGRHCVSVPAASSKPTGAPRVGTSSAASV